MGFNKSVMSELAKVHSIFSKTCTFQVILFRVTNDEMKINVTEQHVISFWPLLNRKVDLYSQGSHLKLSNIILGFSHQLFILIVSCWLKESQAFSKKGNETCFIMRMFTCTVCFISACAASTRASL